METMPAASHYDYDFPPELIAQKPVANRVDARLMVVNRRNQSIEHRHVRDLPELLVSGDHLVLNNTRVLQARLVGRRVRTGGRWQGLFLRADENNFWEMLAKTRGKVEVGETILVEDATGRHSLELTLVARLDNGNWVMRPTDDQPFEALLQNVGRTPLPPYIRGGEMMASDPHDYQTCYASQPGAVAAPTAGLHFTDDLFASLAAKGVGRSFVTLHVGVGTFRPLAVENLADHEMHSEWIDISSETVAEIEAARQAGGRTIAIGTTSVRTLETAARNGSLQAYRGATDLFIHPPYEFQATDGLLTNFHLPRSTLLVLVRTYGGDELMKRAYAEAIEEEYRFYSYGDAMLIL